MLKMCRWESTGTQATRENVGPGRKANPGIQKRILTRDWLCAVNLLLGLTSVEEVVIYGNIFKNQQHI
jgi:hypothetical protein